MPRYRSSRSMRAYWDERARINAAWYVDTTLDFDAPDLDRFFASGEQIVSVALDGSPRRPAAGTALEIGAGLGRVCRALASRFDRVVGLDISEEMLHRARSLVDDPRVGFVVTDGSSLWALRDASVDLVLTFTVFQHIPDVRVVDRYIAEVGRVLKPGGLAVLQWNNLAGPLRWRLRRWATPVLNRIGVQRDRYGRFAPAFMGSRIPAKRMFRSIERSGLHVLQTSDLGTLFAWAWAERHPTS
jgi:SAM-dependent methyltransferase